VTLIVGALVLAALVVPVAATAHGPRVPTPSRPKSEAEMKRALGQEFGKRFTHSTKTVECNRRISRTIVKCAVEFTYHDITWSGNGRIWRAICNGSNGITKNPHHTCWYANWRLERYDEPCHTVEGHSVEYCTEPVIHH
jgi:hypothetical protein